jgi:hypothetical protein
MDDNSTEGERPAGDSGAQLQITADDLRRLLAAAGSACLVLEEGAIRLDSDSSDAQRGLVVITRAELADRIGEDADLTVQAGILTSEVRLLGA